MQGCAYFAEIQEPSQSSRAQKNHMKRVPNWVPKIICATLTIQSRRKHGAPDFVHLWNNRGLEKFAVQLLPPTQINLIFKFLDYRFYEWY